MTEWKRDDDQDMPMSPAHRMLDARMEKIERDLIEHTHPAIDRIIDILDGPNHSQLDGSIARLEEQGLRYKVDRILENQTKTLTARVIAAFTGGVGLSALTVWTRAWELIS